MIAILELKGVTDWLGKPISRIYRMVKVEQLTGKELERVRLVPPKQAQQVEDTEREWNRLRAETAAAHQRFLDAKEEAWRHGTPISKKRLAQLRGEP